MCLSNSEPNPGATGEDAVGPPEDEASFPMPNPTTSPFPSTTPPEPPAPPPPPACETLGASSMPDVPIVTKTGAAPSPPMAIAPPDGSYILVQASSYATDPSGSPFEKVRASISVKGAKVVFGAQATKSGKLESNESFTFTLTTTEIVKFCQLGAGSISSFWFPGGDGVKRPAKIVWDAQLKYVTLVVRTPFGDVELVFAKS